MPETTKKKKNVVDFNRKAKLKTANFVRRVLSRTSNHSKASLEADDGDKHLMEGGEKTATTNFESELRQLRSQIETLQSTVYSMRGDTERKDKLLETVVEEKERLSGDLRRQRRSNVDLRRQLDDERSFYYKEKERYCAEMSSRKKSRQQRKEHEGDGDKDEREGYRKRVAYLEGALDQALEANYNLSVKFLRMKNTKLGLKHQLVKLKELHDFSVHDYGVKLDELRKELDDLADRQLLKPIPPSNKKYLQIIKHNGKLIHENLCLHVEVDRLTLELERMKMHNIRSDTNSRLKYIRSDDRRKSTSAQKIPEKPPASEATTVTSTTKDSPTKVEESMPVEQTPPRPPSFSSDTTRSRIELMNISNSNLASRRDSEVTFYTTLRSYEACRTQSAPEIVQNVKAGLE